MILSSSAKQEMIETEVKLVKARKEISQELKAIRTLLALNPSTQEPEPTTDKAKTVQPLTETPKEGQAVIEFTEGLQLDAIAVDAQEPKAWISINVQSHLRLGAGDLVRYRDGRALAGSTMFTVIKVKADQTGVIVEPMVD